MKKLIFTFFAIIAASVSFGQIVVDQDITSNTTWTANNVYELKAFVYVTNNATLTIEPGTVILGDKATKGTLIITRGAKIDAVGTAEKPIVFTSNEAAGSRTRGSWGGVIILGNARINSAGGEGVVEGGLDATKGKYGGTNDADNSGKLSYVRIEYAGIPFQPNQEINSLTLGGVGSGTQIDHIMVTEGNDDSYEWFGGTVNGKYLIANRGWDDDFDCDAGFSGKIQFGIVYRDPAIADPGSGSSSAFEHDNDGGGTTATPQTAPVFSNMTVIGPAETLTSTINPNYKRAAQLRRNSSTSIFNSAIVGYPNGIFIDGAGSAQNAQNGGMGFKNNVVGGMVNDNFLTNQGSFDINAWATTASFNNSTVVNPTDLNLADPYNADGTIRDFTPTSTSPLISGASFADAKLGGGFFTTTTYRGAIDPNNDWTGCWTKWDPQNENYNTAVKYLASDANATFQKTAGVVTFTNASTNAESYFWDFGDGNTSTDKDPVHTYLTSGDYTVKLKTISGCGSDSIDIQVNDVVTSLFQTVRKVEAKVYPNPAQNTVNVEFDMATAENVKVTISDITGKVLMNAFQADNAFGTQNVRINTTNLNTGVYFVNIATPTSMGTTKVVIIK